MAADNLKLDPEVLQPLSIKPFAPDTPQSANEFDPAYEPGLSEDSLALQSWSIEQARQVLTMEADAIKGVSERLSESFSRAIDLLFNCQGKVVVTGMGKSGHIGNKIAATFASTGTPAFFVHPAELRHGDFGMMDARDVVVALSATGETSEIKLAIEPIKRLGLPIIALTGNLSSTLAKFSDVVLDVWVPREACSLNLAPTSSTTAALAMGDSLAIVLMTRKGFKNEDFARSHPGGSLGQQLLTVADVMRRGVALPVVTLNTGYKQVLQEVTDKKLGFSCVCNDDGTLAGVITEGDLRRAILTSGLDVFGKHASEFMTRNPKTISSQSLAKEALKIMEVFTISALVIMDDAQKPVGLIDLKDLLKAGLI
ncbi:MAG: KpsF/GutQ family sugar-phosphate isomerase [Candidatus Obscuribacterales bacterium]|nr:KpsF/GutQ family sugar-phosphate isomerase [Candidatus Obscuribacterales bacterium]